MAKTHIYSSSSKKNDMFIIHRQ